LPAGVAAPGKDYIRTANRFIDSCPPGTHCHMILISLLSSCLVILWFLVVSPLVYPLPSTDLSRWPSFVRPHACILTVCSYNFVVVCLTLRWSQEPCFRCVKVLRPHLSAAPPSGLVASGWSDRFVFSIVLVSTPIPTSIMCVCVIFSNTIQ
jgi:hypothetical protein